MGSFIVLDHVSDVPECISSSTLRFGDIVSAEFVDLHDNLDLVTSFKTLCQLLGATTELFIQCLSTDQVNRAFIVSLAFYAFLISV
jgi:hypothetical protein